MRCRNCSWRWDIESDDENPYLCHKCGYDSQLGDFDMESFEQWKKENEYPFNEFLSEGYNVRTFKSDVKGGELVWHRDKEDRIVECVGNTDWMVQLDNELPKSLNETVFIPKGVYHRVIKGNGNLTVKIKKL